MKKLALILILLLSGCVTNRDREKYGYQALGDKSYCPYGLTALDCNNIGVAAKHRHYVWFWAIMIDTPLAFALDTAVLPLMLPLEIVRAFQ